MRCYPIATFWVLLLLSAWVTMPAVAEPRLADGVTATQISADVGPASLGEYHHAHLDISSDGSTVFFAAGDPLAPGQTRLYRWRADAGSTAVDKPYQPFGHINVETNHDGSVVAARSFYGSEMSLCVYDGQGGRELVTIDYPTSGAVPRLKLDGAALLFTTAADVQAMNPLGYNVTYSYDVPTGAISLVVSPAMLDGIGLTGLSLVAAADGQREMYSSYVDMLSWYLRDGTELVRLAGGTTTTVYSVGQDLSNDGRTAALYHYLTKAFLYDIPTRRKTPIDLTDNARVAMSGDGRYLYWGQSYLGQLRRLDTYTGKELVVYDSEDVQEWDFSCSYDGSRVALASSDDLAGHNPAHSTEFFVLDVPIDTGPVALFIYNEETGEVLIDTDGLEGTASFLALSTSGVFTGDTPEFPPGSTDIWDMDGIVGMTYVIDPADSRISLGAIMQPGLTRAFIWDDCDIYLSIGQVSYEARVLVVPEPATATMLIAAGAGLLRRRGKRRR